MALGKFHVQAKAAIRAIWRSSRTRCRSGLEKILVLAFLFFSTKNACTGMPRQKALPTPRRSGWRPLGIRTWCTIYFLRLRLRFALEARRNVWRRFWILRAIHVGAARKKPTVR